MGIGAGKTACQLSTGRATRELECGLYFRVKAAEAVTRLFSSRLIPGGHLASTFMYVAMLILFIIPTAILLLAWVRPEKSDDSANTPEWRLECARLARIGATLALMASISFEISWTYNGGSPHGMTPPRGIWKIFGLVTIGSVITSIALGALGKGRGRLLVVASAISIFFVDLLLSMLEMQ